MYRKNIIHILYKINQILPVNQKIAFFSKWLEYDLTLKKDKKSDYDFNMNDYSQIMTTIWLLWDWLPSSAYYKEIKRWSTNCA